MHLVDILIVCFLLCLFSLAYKYVDSIKAEYEFEDWKKVADQAFRSITFDKRGNIKTYNKDGMDRFVDLYIFTNHSRKHGQTLFEEHTLNSEIKRYYSQIKNWTISIRQMRS